MGYESKGNLGSIYVNLPKANRNPANEKKVEQILDALESMGAYLGITVSEDKLSAIDANEKGYKPVLAFVSKYRKEKKGAPHMSLLAPKNQEASKSYSKPSGGYKPKSAPAAKAKQAEVAQEEDDNNPFA